MEGDLPLSGRDAALAVGAGVLGTISLNFLPAADAQNSSIISDCDLPKILICSASLQGSSSFGRQLTGLLSGTSIVCNSGYLLLCTLPCLILFCAVLLWNSFRTA
jgi:hypothetical protein